MLKKLVGAALACASLTALAPSATAQEIPDYCYRTNVFGGGRTEIPDCVDTVRRANEAQAVTNLTGLTTANVCAVLGELRIPGISAQQARTCHRTGEIDERVFVRAVRNAQSLLRTRQDGWLKSNEFVELACIGVSRRLPHSDRYVGWMFAMGRGLSENIPAAHMLLERGLIYLEGQASRLDGADLAHHTVMMNQTRDLLNRLGEMDDREPTDAEINEMCLNEVRRIRQLGDTVVIAIAAR